MKIHNECFKRKTLTSGIESDIMIFAGDKPDKQQKEIWKNWKKCLTTKWGFDKIIFDRCKSGFDPWKLNNGYE